MSEFSPDWLTLREPFDAASRRRDLCVAIAPAIHNQPLQIVDLGAGTGSNFRYMAPLIGGSQEWLFVERDPALCEAADGRMQVWADSVGARCVCSGRECSIGSKEFECRIRIASIDLAAGIDAIAFQKECLVTASALLDLASADWLARLARRCADAAACVYFALTYDGRIEFSPSAPDDSEVRNLFNRHQRTDKGFGPALGPEAGSRTACIFRECGYRIRTESSDWRIGPEYRAIQRALITGYFDAARTIAPDRVASLRRWYERRLFHIDDGRSQLLVGHVDTIGWPGER